MTIDAGSGPRAIIPTTKSPEGWSLITRFCLAPLFARLLNHGCLMHANRKGPPNYVWMAQSIFATQ